MRIARKVLILALGGSTIAAGAAIAFGALTSAASVAPAKAPVATVSHVVAADAVASPDNYVWG